MERNTLTRFAWLSIAAALITIGLKSAAYLITGSVGLLSDALESLVNLVAAIMALAMLTIAARPPDDEHAYGHAKAEYFSSGVEGALIFVRSEEHTFELQSRGHLVCRLLLGRKNSTVVMTITTARRNRREAPTPRTRTR